MLLPAQNSKVIIVEMLSDLIKLAFETELHILRDILMHKYGREFSLSVMENRDDCVPKRVRF